MQSSTDFTHIQELHYVLKQQSSVVKTEREEALQTLDAALDVEMTNPEVLQMLIRTTVEPSEAQLHAILYLKNRYGRYQEPKKGLESYFKQQQMDIMIAYIRDFAYLKNPLPKNI